MSDQEKAALEAGIDLSLLELNLTLTPEERIEKHDAALELFLDLKMAGKILRHES